MIGTDSRTVLPDVSVGARPTGAMYLRGVARPYSAVEQVLRVSSKVSEHNIHNMPVFLIQRSNPAQVHSAMARRMVSNPVVLPGGQ